MLRQVYVGYFLGYCFECFLVLVLKGDFESKLLYLLYFWEVRLRLFGTFCRVREKCERCNPSDAKNKNKYLCGLVMVRFLFLSVIFLGVGSNFISYIFFNAFWWPDEPKGLPKSIKNK